MVNLFIMGDSAQIRAHQEAITDFEDIILIENDGEHLSLDLATVDGLVLLDVEDKDYWIKAAIEADIFALSTHPIHRQVEPVKKMTQGVQLSHIHIMSLGLHTEFCTRLIKAQAAIQPASHFVIDLDINSSSQTLSRESFSDQMALSFCDLLLATWGPVDVLYSRMRNFFHSGPNEDTMTVFLTMHNGAEGLFMLVDSSSPHSTGRIRSYSIDGQVDISTALAFQRNDLRSYYRSFINAINGQSEPLLSLSQVAESYQLLQWMRKSARADESLSKRESR